MAVLLYNCSNLPLKTFEKKYKSAKVSSQVRHEIIWYEDKVCIYEWSEITAPEVVKKVNLDNHQPCHIEAIMWREYLDHPNPTNCTREPENEENQQPETNEIITSKGTVINSAGILRTHPQSTELPLSLEYCMSTPDCVSYKWAGYLSNNPHRLS